MIKRDNSKAHIKGSVGADPQTLGFSYKPHKHELCKNCITVWMGLQFLRWTTPPVLAVDEN